MADMFGAPIGIAAAETDMRQNVLGALQAQKVLGEIGMQPAEQELKQAHARLYGAEADLKQSQVADQRAMGDIAANVAASRRAQAEGRILTVGDAPEGSVRAKSLAEPYEQMLELATLRGVNPLVTEKLAGMAAGIRQKEASAASAQAEQVLRTLNAQEKRAERLGELASAGKLGEQQYAQARMQAAQEGFDVSRLPQSWQEAQPLLDGLITASMKTKDAIAAKRQAEELKAKEPLWRAETAKNFAAAEAARSRAKLAEQTYALRVKYDGATSKRAQEDKTSLNARRDTLSLKELDLSYPQAPLDPSMWKEGKSYRINGKFFRAVKGPDGKIGGELIDVPESLRKLATKGAVAAAAPDEDADTTDEGDE